MATPLQKRKLMGEINVVPYIDVMLVLLVIFMVTAPLLTQGIEVDLPEANAEPIDSSSDRLPLVVSVDAEGFLYLSVGDEEDKPVAREEVVAQVARIMRNAPETPILVKADRNVDYGFVVGAMVALWFASVTFNACLIDAGSVSMVTDPSTELSTRSTAPSRWICKDCGVPVGTPV